MYLRFYSIVASTHASAAEAPIFLKGETVIVKP